ncbi:major facilitator superfamily domain-containing protein [Lasiosphaeria miniovina]|uniref:Major facilitator superfamily domain-containing protein n=1 Tax=Lasiosphaeria miniovina TaxID=1954250 RepID=A0AA40E9B0_9PEZI|nr:major facilitator superfamily domain-containing protein [Lasiosphaeria miniovina]KAK0727128.1 major facilitator superfamily domain-containing protein [Lasiosphaeria miniovina]
MNAELEEEEVGLDRLDQRRRQEQDRKHEESQATGIWTGSSDLEHDSINEERRGDSDREPAHVSLGQGNPVEHYSSFFEVPDAIYDKFPPHRKAIIVALLSFCAFLSPISSTSVLAATPEVAAEYSTDGSIINVVNAVYLLMMGISPIIWGPMSEVYGRRRINQISAVLFCGCSIGTALAPNLVAFFIFRILTAFQGTAFILVGSACIGDIYRPTERATALGWFMSGTLIGPAFGPFVGGIIVTYTSWRVIFWLQAGLAGVAAAGTFTALLPETIHQRKSDHLVGLGPRKRAVVLWSMVNPGRVLALLISYPNLAVASIASSAAIWNMYSLLTPIRYVLNPRFGLETPMQGGLFYLAPGFGYLVGTTVGGRWADHTVKKWIACRNGVRVPEDRLRAAVPFLGIAIPVCVLIYGWGVEENVGGIPLAVVTLFLQGVSQMFCFTCLNTYCLDVMQGRSAEVIAGNYFVRYSFACAATACVLPAVRAIGVGWFSTVSALFLVAAAASTLATIRWGKGWRDRVDAKRRVKRAADHAITSKELGEGKAEEGKGEEETGV